MTTMASKPLHLPNEVIEELVGGLMWKLQEDRLEGKKEKGAEEGLKQLNVTSRKIIRQYAAIPLVSRSFRDAYLRFFTTLPALSYDASRAPGEVRLYRQPALPSPSAAATLPYIVAAPGVVKMLAAIGKLGHLKWVHITTTTSKYLSCEVVGASPLKCLYQLLGVLEDDESATTSTNAASSSGGDGKSDGGGKVKAGRKRKRREGKQEGGKNSKGREKQNLTAAGSGCCSSDSSNGPTPLSPTHPLGVLLELDGAHVELCAEKMSRSKMATASHNFMRGGGLERGSWRGEWIALNVALGLNATALHIGYTANSLTATPAFYIPASPAEGSFEAAGFVSHEDFSRITRLMFSAQVKPTTEMTIFPSEDWIMLVGRVLEKCSGCRELRWELTDEGISSWTFRKNTLLGMAEEVLPAIKSPASILIYYNFAPESSENKNMRQRHFEHDQVLFQFGQLVAQVDKGDNGRKMTREIIVTTTTDWPDEKWYCGDDAKEKSGDLTEEDVEEMLKPKYFLDQLAWEEDAQKERQSMGRRSIRWSILKYS